MSDRSIARSSFGWGDSTRRARTQHAAERYAVETCVTLPDGQLMYVRKGSLVAAKDLLAAQRAAERRLAQQRERRLLELANEVVEQRPGDLPR